MKHVAVFCGSSSSVPTSFMEVARTLGHLIAQQKVELVYGGASIGLMGALADGVLEKGGLVTGFIPSFLRNKEARHEKIQNLILVESMHERKMKMAERADAFIALPGGFGTLDELFEIITWRQIHLHQKKIGILNHEGFFDSLLQFCEHAWEVGLVREEHLKMLIVEKDPQTLLEKVLNNLH